MAYKVLAFNEMREISNCSRKSFQNWEWIERIDKDLSISTKPYILTNESRLEESYTGLLQRAVPKSPFHIGFSGWHNFDIMAVRNSSGGLIFDISNSTYEMLQLTQKVLSTSSDRFDFVDHIVKLFEQEPEKYYRMDLLPDAMKRSSALIQTELHRKTSWLASDDTYNHLRALTLNHSIRCFRMNIKSYCDFEIIKKWMHVNQLNLDTLYVSNIGDWFYQSETSTQDLRMMNYALHKVIEDDTLIIDASDYFVSHKYLTPLPQRIFIGKDYSPAKVRGY